MSNQRKQRSATELSEASTHVLHEYNAFNAQQDALKTKPLQPIRSALYEASMVHLRNLCDFFSPPKDPAPDDIIAADFGGPVQSLPVVLERARVAANKQVAHLTYDRNVLPIEGQRLPWEEIRRELEVLVDTFSRKPPRTPIRFVPNMPLAPTANFASTSDTTTPGFDPPVKLKAERP